MECIEVSIVVYFEFLLVQINMYICQWSQDVKIATVKKITAVRRIASWSIYLFDKVRDV